MLVENQDITKNLRGIVYKICKEPSLADDLLQEALLYLWQIELKNPNQTKSWYLQGCQFHLMNFMRGGRSVDALKRKSGAVCVEEYLNDQENRDDFCFDNPVFGEVTEKDMLRVLCNRLPSIAQEILAHLKSGYQAKEIAAILNVSTRTVSKYKRSIADKASQLGILPHC